MNFLLDIKTPQLEKIHSGKVRESFRVDKNSRLIVATDRISSFDNVLKTPIPGKGAVLNQLAGYWFENTRDIVDNHFIKLIDQNISLVKEASPIRVEMIVRGYLTGSAWRGYQNGKRKVSGVTIPEGMKKNQALPRPQKRTAIVKSVQKNWWKRAGLRLIYIKLWRKQRLNCLNAAVICLRKEGWFLSIQNMNSD
jgi:phosphoribosylaminoimidazole-succinocarboxamide synthase